MDAAPSAPELTRRLIRFDTRNPPGGEEACARHLARMLEEGGFSVSYDSFGDGRMNLVATLDGGGERPPLCLTGHMDTVPLGAVPWRHDPFAADIADGRLYGRGASDMKSGVAAMVVAGLRLAGLSRPRAGLVLVLTGGEETGCDGAYHLARAGGALGRAGAVVVGEPTSNYPFVGHKGALWLEAVTTGVTAHGSMPEKGVNAVYRAARAAVKLEDFDFNVARHPVLGPPTLNLGTISGGMNINSVPDRAVMGIDIRTIPEQSHADVRVGLQSYLGDEVDLTPLVDVGGVYTDPGDAWMREVFDIMGRILGETPEPRAAPYFTDAAVLTPAYGGVPTVILGPGELAMAHRTDEYCVVERIDQAVEAYVEIARRWCGG